MDSIPCGKIKTQSNTMNVENNQTTTTTYSKVISHVFFTGTAKQGSAGPPIGLVDIGVSEVAYIFRVSLPGIEKNQSKLSHFSSPDVLSFIILLLDNEKSRLNMKFPSNSLPPVKTGMDFSCFGF